MNKISKKLYVIGSIVLTCLICLVVVLTLNISKNYEDVLANDEQVTITVNKINTVTIYVNGEHVVKENSDLSKDVYKVTKNSSITLRCVNESRLFSEWYIEDDEKNKVEVSNSQNSLISINAEKNLHVSSTRTDPTIYDLGKYMDNPFIISEQQHIIYLQNIFDYANNNSSVSEDNVKEAYNYFFQSDPNFQLNEIKSDYFSRIQNGYFKVEQSLTILDDEFKGIGSGEKTFKGVICGSNSSSSTNAQIFTSMNITDSGDNDDVYCGLFKKLTKEAVIRNLIIQNSIAINSNNASSNNSIYGGGVAGKIEDALLNNVTVSTTINITSNSKKIYAGGISGTMTSGGINEHDNINLDFSGHVWVLTSNLTGNSIYGGIIAGYAENVYIQKASINVSKFAINAKNIASNTYNTNTNVYIGNLFGYYNCSSEKYIDNISFTGNDSEYLQSTISNGLSYVGGLIGYVDTTSASLNIGSVRFEMNTTNKSSIISESLDKNSCTNLYAGGLFAYIDGNNLKATDEFKNGIITIVVDEKNVDTYQFIFDTPMEIITKQHGIQDNNNTYGNSIAGGLVANGYFNISGSDDKRADILLSSDETEFSVQAIQTSSSSHTLTGDTYYISENNLNNNPKHCLAALMFGYVDAGSDSNSNSNLTYSYENINVYANNVNVEATREIGSRSLGDVSSTGFLCYTKSRNLQNITMYLGSNTSIMARSLSYEVGYQGNTIYKYISSNNAYASSFISYVGSSILSNIEISGFNFSNKQQVGTSVQVQGIQNSIAVSGSGCHDYSNENYVGGVVGCIKGDCTLNKITFTGNSNGESQIVMEGHKDPNSAFVGGIVGFSQLMQDTSYSSATQKLTDCTIKYGKVIGNATINTAQYGNPDIYGGGILGACYSDDHSLSGTLTINSPKVLYSSIECNGNERIETYVGGILGTITWSGSATATISDAYVYKSKISSSIDATQKWSDTGTHVASRAAGIICDYVGKAPTVNYSAVIDTEINAYTSSTIGVGTSEYTIAAGISTKAASLTNCYSNSTLKSQYGSDNSNTYELNSSYPNGSYYATDSTPTTANDSALVFQKFEFTNGEQKSLFDIDKFTYNNIKKFYIKIYNTDGFKIQSDDSKGVQVKANKNNCSSEAEIWINATKDGDSKAPYDYMTEEDRINAGWFNLGNVYLVCGSESEIGNVDNITTSYIYQNIVYNYNEDLGYKQSEDKKTFEVYLKSTLPTIQISFSVSSSSIYYIEWNKEVGNNPLVGYGSYTYVYTKDEIKDNTYNYTLTYTPNVEIEDDATVIAQFLIGSNVSSSTYNDLVFTFNLYANKYFLKGVTLAEYTPALNANITEKTGTTETDSYLFLKNTSYRLIPVLSRVNESDKEIISELYCQKVSYEFVNNTKNTIRSNGEITTDDSNDTTCSVKLTLKNSSGLDENQKEKTICFKVVEKYTVSTKSDGSNISGLPFTTSASSYVFDVSVLSHCGGIPSNDSKITVANENTYYMSTILANGWVYADEKAEEPLTEWDANATSYQIRIPNNVTDNNNNTTAIITGNISIDITFPVYYTVEFHIQTDTFNPEFGEKNPLTFSVKVAEGTTFNNLFYNENGETSYATELNNWVKNAENASFGYLLTGFYLIDDSSSESAYGQSFETLKSSSLKINTSYVFFARWSFLIELVEAPGTHIVTSFNQDFLYTVDKDKEEYKYFDGTNEINLLNKNIEIPINNNRGYVFTIEKDENFIGEADVEAFIVTKDGTKNDINEIPIEKYHDNMYLYYIKPELITGYLVIATKISNSDVIVGENTASVTETIIPEDGIYTFKYIANHKKGESYIYKNNNMSLKRDILLQFKKQTYKSNKTEIEAKELTDGTIIEVYYNKYINASKTSSSTIAGRYLVTKENKSSEILLSEFNNINGEGRAFDDVTFEELLGNNDSVSEVYYFVIIPPNGSTTAEYNNDTYTISGGYHNEYLYVGYCYESIDDEGQNVYNFIEGKRSENEFVNNPIAGTLENYLRTESALQIGSYTTTPSRKTSLEQITEPGQTNKSNTYHFIDDNKFKVFDVTIANGEVNENNRLVFKEGLLNKTTITSSIISQEISELRLNFGYNKGIIKVSFYDESDNLKKEEEIEITNETYQDYIINNIPTSSKYFKIEKITNDEIRLSKLGVVVSDGGMLYEMEFSKTDFNSLYIPSVTVYDLNLPQLTNLEWTIEDSNNAILVNNKLEILGEGEVTLTATYTHNNIVETKTFNVFVTLQGSTKNYIDKIMLPSNSGSSLYLPTFNGLEWRVKDETIAKIENNKLILLGSSNTIKIYNIYNNLQSDLYEIYMEADTNTYSLSYLITGDTRHDGKHFILAVQTKNKNGEIVSPQNIAIQVNSKTYSPIINNSSIVTAYFDLSVILDELGTNNFDLEIISNDYTIYAVQLLEVENAYKPAMGEIRTNISLKTDEN